MTFHRNVESIRVSCSIPAKTDPSNCGHTDEKKPCSSKSAYGLPPKFMWPFIQVALHLVDHNLKRNHAQRYDVDQQKDESKNAAPCCQGCNANEREKQNSSCA